MKNPERFLFENIIDYSKLRQRTLTEKMDIMSEASPYSDYINFLNMQNRVTHRANLSYQNLEMRLKEIFKRIPSDIFIDRLEKFKKIRDDLLKVDKSNLKESKLAKYLKGETQLEENCRYIREVCMYE